MDAPLLTRIADGDLPAVRQVVDRYGDLVWSLARCFTNSDADAEDAVQDIFLTLWRKAGRYDPALGAEVTFVSVLARRVLIDRWRRNKRIPGADEIGRVREHLSPATRQQPAELAAVTEAFGALKDELQVVLRLSIEHGCTHEMISEITGLPLGTVKTRIRKGLTLVREQMAATGDRAGGGHAR